MIRTKEKIKVLFFLLLFIFVFSACNIKINNKVEEKKEYTISFDTNGGNILPNQQIIEGNTLQSITPIKEGYTFDGWMLDGKAFDYQTSITKDITLIATWCANTYTLYFEGNGAIGSMNSLSVDYDETISLPKCKFVYEGNKFLGWAIDVNGDVKYQDEAGLTFNTASDMHLYAVWMQLSYLSFHGNDQTSGAMVGSYFEKGDKFVLPKCTYIKEGYTFMGWSTNSRGEVEYEDEEEIILDFDSNTFLYAIWKENEVDYVGICEDLISSIGYVDENSFDKIKKAIDYYQSINNEYQNKVSNITTLYDDMALYCNLYLDTISSDITKTEIDNIKYLYNKLADSKDKVSNYYKIYQYEYALTYQSKLENIDKEYQDVLVKIAMSYYYQGTQIQYDQSNSRRNLYLTIENATSAQNMYLDCSSFVENIYYNTFGITICDSCSTEDFMNYAKKSKNNDIIYLIQTSDYTTSSAQSKLLNEIKNNLQVGDLIVYRHGVSSATSGHVLMYIGNNQFIHCTGSSMSVSTGKTDPTTFVEKQTQTEKTNGAIQLLSTDSLLADSSSSRYLFKETTDDTVYEFALIRPLARKNLSLTDYAMNKYLVSDLDFEKTSSVNSFNSLKVNDTITYTVKITNKSTNLYQSIYMVENIPTNLEYVSSDGIYVKDENKIYFYVTSINSKANVSFSYTLKVKEDASIGSIICDSDTLICGINLNKIYHSVCKNLDNNAFISNALTLVGSSYANMLSAINDCYNMTISETVFQDTTKEDNVLKGLLSYYYITKDSVFYSYMAPNMYGGTTVAYKDNLDNNRIRKVDASYLECGDVIFTHTTYKESTFSSYLYLNKSLILGLKDGKVVKAYDTVNAVSDFLITLVAYDRFCVLRPKMKNS